VSAAVRVLVPEPLTAAAFAEFGDVIEVGQEYELINRGTARKFADLGRVDVATNGGRPCISLYRATPFELPLTIAMLERHPLSSQLFMPLNGEQFLVVVAPPGDRIDPAAVRAFLTDGRQGINYHRGTWHHPLIALRDPSEFLVVDRAGHGRNCDEFHFEHSPLVLQPPIPRAG
jgi:ureidoglycolate lyase